MPDELREKVKAWSAWLQEHALSVVEEALIHLELRTHWLELPDPKPSFDEYLSSSLNELLVSEIHET